MHVLRCKKTMQRQLAKLTRRNCLHRQSAESAYEHSCTDMLQTRLAGTALQEEWQQQIKKET